MSNDSKFMLVPRLIQYQDYPTRILKLPPLKRYSKVLQISKANLKNKKIVAKGKKYIKMKLNYRNEKYSNRNNKKSIQQIVSVVEWR